MTKLLIISDDGHPSGYGRISMETNMRLVRRGHNIHALSFAYDGMLPPQIDGSPLAYWVTSVNGNPNWVEKVLQLVPVLNPDVIICTQDFPFAQAIRYAPLDWSKHKFIIITPVDGKPIYPLWIEVAKKADAVLTISEFGVEAFREAGVQVGLCRPAANLNSFYRLPDGERLALRERAGISPTAFVLGTAAMNQGRKCIAHMIEGFFDFAADKPDARYILDMDKVSPAGWDIENMICQPRGYDFGKLLFREDLFRLGIMQMRDRYALMDAHVVLSHREGFGLPLVEAQACGVVSMALDYCSGREICGDGKGVLIKALDYTTVSTWGGADDYHPNVKDFVKQLNTLYTKPHERLAIAERGMEWARSFTWDMAADAVQNAIEKVMQMPTPPIEQMVTPDKQLMTIPQAVKSSPDGVNVESMETVKA